MFSARKPSDMRPAWTRCAAPARQSPRSSREVRPGRGAVGGTAPAFAFVLDPERPGSSRRTRQRSPPVDRNVPGTARRGRGREDRHSGRAGRRQRRGDARPVGGDLDVSSGAHVSAGDSGRLSAAAGAPTSGRQRPGREAHRPHLNDDRRPPSHVETGPPAPRLGTRVSGDAGVPRPD